MKTIFITLAIMLGISSGVQSQIRHMHPLGRGRRHPAPLSLTISGTYRMGLRKASVCEMPMAYQQHRINNIETNYPTRNYHLKVTIKNLNPSVDITNIKYDAQFFSKDGVYLGNQMYAIDDTICKRCSLTFKKRLKCPKDCKTIALSIVPDLKVVQRGK